MGFSTAVSGLNAAANMLSVTGNNIANVNTTGFKNSRSEFADVYSTSIGSGGKTTPGSGVVTANVALLFGQGNLQATGNNLDLAISGEGFFVLGENTSAYANHSYTRAGNFHTDQDGYVVSNNGQPLLAYRANGSTVEEGFSTGVLEPLRLDTGEGKPAATTQIDTAVNLDARKPTIDPVTTPFVGPVGGVVDPATYTSSSSVTVYDSLGNSHLVSHYFVNRVPTLPGAASQWDVYTTVDGTNIETPLATDTLTFDSSGKLTSAMPISYNPFPITAPKAED
ncbi:MAG: flagellar hook-basal body protein, partial [Proteobacteria bacterium]|nr:flagellar hook-basal body protein [Pseudomonadota bacterium]